MYHQYILVVMRN